MFLRGFKSYFRLFLRALLSLILILVSQTFRTVSPPFGSKVTVNFSTVGVLLSQDTTRAIAIKRAMHTNIKFFFMSYHLLIRLCFEYNPRSVNLQCFLFGKRLIYLKLYFFDYYLIIFKIWHIRFNNDSFSLFFDNWEWRKEEEIWREF